MFSLSLIVVFSHHVAVALSELGFSHKIDHQNRQPDQGQHTGDDDGSDNPTTHSIISRIIRYLFQDAVFPISEIEARVAFQRLPITLSIDITLEAFAFEEELILVRAKEDRADIVLRFVVIQTSSAVVRDVETRLADCSI